MPKAKQRKYINLEQFPYKNGKISWIDAIGKEFVFYYNDKPHILKILEKVKKDYYKIVIDNIHIFEKSHITKIINLNFIDLFYEPDYKYKVGQVVNNCTILKCFSSKKRGRSDKMYLCKCNNDGYEFESTESNLTCGHGCPVCCGRIVVKGINDLATTDPNVVQYLANIEDAYTYTRKSMAYVDVKCPFCKTVKKMTVAELTRQGKVTCDMCSDGVSYPNKFAHEMFRQLRGQYVYYEYEYRPDWANLYRYDNYIELFDGIKIVVEMDGHFHKMFKEVKYNDEEKDRLAFEHNIKVIRINCDYIKIEHRFDLIKNSIINKLSDYFDLSVVNWEMCNSKSMESKIISVINDYNNNPKMRIQDIAKNNHISMGTMYGYLYIGESLGLCKYIRADNNRINNSKPIAMYDLNGDLIGVFKSSRQIAESFPDKNFLGRNIRSAISKGKNIYKGYYFRFASYEEYINY